ncbi:response regulator [Croceitalea sp. MTPC9]|uniref:response regulator n=1 Tax=unclassified Croceitalea TaxID=2632280 RepID=UPI002B38DBDC|nr:response regulator [Croceitalea sp. MTPC6]GMN17974.1 response regulator [Croceitalea sp. MTPC9]
MKKILVIEDDGDVRENTAEILRLSNYKVETAQDGNKGIEKTAQFHPDLIICDIMMPGLNGYSVLQRLNEDSATASIPFIFLTAKTSRSDMRIGMNLGADDYLTKPFEEEELMAAVSCRLRKNDFLKKEIAKNLEELNTFIEDASDYMDLGSFSKGYDVKKYEKKDVVFWEGDPAHSLFFIESGSVKTYKSTEIGKEFVTGICGVGNFIGQLSLLNSTGTYIENAIVLEDSELCAIPKDDFTKLLYGSPLVSQKFISMISNNLKHVQEQLVDMAYASVRKRAAKALLELYEKGLVQEKPDGGIGIPREDFAGIIGTATETVIRTLSDFKDEGLVSTGHGRRIIILNKEKLKSLADFG